MGNWNVDPNAAAGGDGTTDALTGANCAYQTLNIWEAAKNTGTLTEVEYCTIRANGANKVYATGTFALAGGTPSESAYLDITVDPAYRHVGVKDSSKAHHTSGRFSISQSYCRLNGLQNIATFLGYMGTTSAHYTTLENILTSCYDDGASFSFYSSLILGTNCSVTNCVIYDGWTTMNCGSYNTFTNCTFVDGYHSASAQAAVAGNSTFINCLFRRNPSDPYPAQPTVHDSGTGNAFINCAVDDASITTGGTNCRTNQTFTFVNESTHNFTLDASDTGAKGYGTFTGAPSTDIAGNTRVGVSAIDIGAFQITAAPAFLAAWASGANAVIQ